MTQNNEQQQANEVRKAPAVIALDERGLLAPRDSGEDARVAQMMLDTRVLPVCFETQQQVILAVQMLRSLQIPPALGLRQVMVVNNALAIWGTLPKAACDRHIEKFDEFRFDKNYTPITFGNKNLHETPLGSYTCIKRRDVDQLIEGYFTMGQAQKAGLLNKKGPWQGYTDMMLMYRGRSRALLTGFADVLMGTPIAEYDYNIREGRGSVFYGTPEAGTATELAEEINQLAEAVEGTKE